MRPLDLFSKRALRSLLPLVFGSLIGLVSAQSEPVLELTLDEAMRIALDNDLELASRSLDTQAAALNARGSWGSFDPVLSLTGSLSDSQSQGATSLAGADVVENDSQTFNGSLSLPFQSGGTFRLDYGRSNDRTNNIFATFDVSTTDTVSLSFNQPLLRGGWRRYATLDQRDSQLTSSVATQAEVELRHQLLLDVANAYWDLVRTSREVDVRLRAHELGERALGQERRRLELGAGTEVDVLQAETNLAQRDQEILRARFDRAQAEDTLRRRLFQSRGEDRESALSRWDERIEPSTPLPKPQPQVSTGDWRTALARAIDARPSLVSARLEIERSDLSVDRSRSGWLPRLDLDLSARSSGFDRVPDEAFDLATSYDFPSYEGSLTFEMPLWNRSGRYSLRSAKVGARKARLAYEQAELAVLAEVRAGIRELEFQQLAIIAAEKSRELAERQLEAEEARRANGLSTTFQVLEFQQTLAEASSTEAAALASFAKALAAMAHAEGRIDEWIRNR